MYWSLISFSNSFTAKKQNLPAICSFNEKHGGIRIQFQWKNRKYVNFQNKNKNL